MQITAELPDAVTEGVKQTQSVSEVHAAAHACTQSSRTEFGESNNANTDSQARGRHRDRVA